MTKRSIPVMVLLYLFTFGIFPLYWFIKFQSELKKETGEGASGLVHFILAIVTVGIYVIVWQYLAGKRLAKQGAMDKSVLYLVFSFVLLSWLNPFLMQNQANRLN